MHVPEIERALARLERLRRFRDEQGRELLDVPRAPLPDAETPAPVRFLPKWDNVLHAFANRTRVLPEEHRKRVIRMNGHVAQTFLVDGMVAGTWRVADGPDRARALRGAVPLGATRARGRGGASGGVPRRRLGDADHRPEATTEDRGEPLDLRSQDSPRGSPGFPEPGDP